MVVNMLRNPRGEPVVQLLSTNTKVTNTVAEWFLAEGIELRVQTDPSKWPPDRAAEFVLTPNQLSAKVERFAMRLGAQVAVMPEALDFVKKKCQEGKVIRLVSYDAEKHGY